MRLISNIPNNYPAPPPQAAGANAPGSANNGFPLTAAAARLGTPAPGQGVSGGISPSLGAQTISTLLQTQDLSQLEGHGGGGGGDHHGGMKMLQGLEAEEAFEGEEAQLLKRRRKLMKMLNRDGVDETAEAEEGDAPAEDATRLEEQKPDDERVRRDH